jgi:primase-polymerase (primpol)-like protein
MIAPALEALKSHRQFIVYKLSPSQTRPGKLDKFPCDASGRVVSAHDAAHWMSAAGAASRAQQFGTGWGIGFVLTPEAKRFCFDIDNCLQPDGQWSSLALQLCGLFPGAAVEVSASGTGLHIWGSYSGDMPAHACKNTALGIELYTDKRFVALGLPVGTVGDVATDCTLPLQAAIALYFPPDSGDGLTQWTTEPVPEWRGPVDDSELIRRASAAQSTASAFGGKASFADLWTGNLDALGRSYPAEGRAYDASSADAALAQRLAYWTGANCERIERLMRQSALDRDKWDAHASYLSRTILGAVGRQEEVLIDEATRRREQIEEAMAIGEGSDEIRLAGTVALDEMLPRFVFIQDGQQVVDLQQPQHVAALGDWKATLKASTTTLEVKGQYNFDGTPKTKTYETSALWEKNPLRQISQAVTFLAGGKRVVRDPKGREAVNTWNAPARITAPGDPSVFLDHVAYLFGEDAPRFLDWLAHIEQKPGELPQFGWLHISDKQGTGRNWIASVIARLWPGYAAVNFDLPALFRTGFNDRLSSKVIAVVDEINDGGNDSKWRNSETMKSLINEGQRTINPKFGRIREEFNACRWLVFSNHRSALALTETDRRLNVVIREGTPREAKYYRGLYAALKAPGFIAGVAHSLRTRDLSDFNPGEHAAMTGAKEAVIAANRSEADETLLDVVKHWPADVIQSSTLGELITGQLGGKITPAHRHALERRGIRGRKNPVWVGNSTCRVSILRNPERWEGADAYLIATELAKVPQQLPLGGIRAYLDTLTAA